MESQDIQLMRFTRPVSFNMVRLKLKDSSRRLMNFADYVLHENIVRALLLEDDLSAQRYLIKGTEHDTIGGDIVAYNVNDFTPEKIDCNASKKWDYTRVAFVTINTRLGTEYSPYDFNTKFEDQPATVPYLCSILPEDPSIHYREGDGVRGEDSLTNYFKLDAGKRLHRARGLGVLGHYNMAD